MDLEKPRMIPLAEVETHAPVPSYEEPLSKTTDAPFERMAGISREREIWRELGYGE